MAKYSISAAAALAIATAFSAQALASAPKLLQKSGDWSSYVYHGRGGKVCYATSEPTRAGKGVPHRGAPLFSVTNRTSDKSAWVISIDMGVKLKAEAPVALEIGRKTYALYAKDNEAWALHDKETVQAMMKAGSVAITATAHDGKHIADLYAMKGFSQSLAAIDRECGLRPK